jgi:LysM repeat protein
MQRVLFLTLLLTNLKLSFAGGAEVRYSANDYIETYKAAAIEEMTVYGIPASITLGQGMLESDLGNSELARYANNHFGLKCHKEWKGETFNYHDDEWNECFRKYDHPLESYADHSFFLKSRPRYTFLFDLQITDYKSWALGLKEAGYATLPSYAIKLIDIIEKYRLYELDKNGFIAPSILDIGTKKASSTKKELVFMNTHKPVNFKYGQFVVVKQGDTFSKIAREFNIGLGSLLKYNEVENNDTLHQGDIVFIEPKKKKDVLAYHIVTKGENMKAISRRYGVDLKFLCERNKLSVHTKPKPGTILYLQKKK